MHVCVICRRRSRTTDQESTSEAGPSLVPPLTGSTNPVQASDHIPPADPMTTPASATDVPRADVTCSSGFHTADSGQMGHTSGLLGSAVAPDHLGAVSSLGSVADRGPGPMLTAAQSAVTSMPDAGSVAYEESGWGSHPGDAPPSSTSALVEDGGQEVTAASCANTEDLMELDSQIIPHPDGCRPGVSVTVQGPECQHVSCNDLPANSEESEDVDSENKQDCPKPPSTSGQDGEEGCFSLATALKELHKLLVTSGQGSARAGDDDEALSSEADLADVAQGNHQGSSQIEEPGNDFHNGDGPSGQVTDETSPCIEADAPGGSFQVPYDCLSERMESSAAEQPLPGIVLNHDAVTGATCNPGDPAAGDEQLQGLSSEPGGPVCEWSASAQPSDLTSPSAVERIVAAGFTMQDALVALEGSDGDVELALLALLARNIVVPT